MIESMRLFVTGVSGPIGKNLVEQLVDQGHQLLVVSASGSDVSTESSSSGIRFLQADLSIPGAWQQELDGCDLVFHLIDPVTDDGEPEAPERSDAMMQTRIDAMFQVAWALEHAKKPPRGLVVQSSPRALEVSDHPTAVGFRTLEAVAGPLKRAGVAVLINRSPGPEQAVSTLLSSMKVILESSCEVGKASEVAQSSVVPARTSTASTPSTRPADPRLGPALVLSLDEYLITAGVLTPSVKALLKKLSDRGIPLIFTTARSAIEAMAFSDQLGVGDLVIAGDGSALLDVSSREVVRTELLTAEQVMGVGLAVRTSESSIGIQIEKGRHAYCSLPRPVPERLEWLFGTAREVPFTELLQRPATRILLHGSPRRLAHSVEDICESWVRQKLVKISHYDRNCLGILGTTAERAVALQHAESILGVPRFSSLIFIGEGDAQLLHGWKHSCTWAGMSQELSSRVSCVVPAGSPDETFEFLVKALQAI